jgi:thiamine pyrophosphate-dependent acetolactate synthase large subunit-like protein
VPFFLFSARVSSTALTLKAIHLCNHTVIFAPLICTQGTATKGLGGFQETDQLPIFEPITKEQVNVFLSHV